MALLGQELRQELTDDASENFLVGVEKVWKVKRKTDVCCDAAKTVLVRHARPTLGMGSLDAARCFTGWPQEGPAPKTSGDHSPEAGS